MSHIPEGIATSDGREPDTPNAGICAQMSLNARVQMQQAHLARDYVRVQDAMAVAQEWAPTTLRRGH